MPPDMNLLGWYLEERPGEPGMRIVLVQPHEDPEQAVEHVCETPRELWAAFEAIASDPDVPRPETNSGYQHDDDEETDERAVAAGDIRGMAMEAAESFITQATHPLLGRIAGEAMRNPTKAIEFLRSISRKDRR